MSFSPIIKALKALPQETPVHIVLETNKKELNEMNIVNGSWRNKDYSFEVNTCWRSGEIYCDEMDLNDLMTLLKKRKSLDAISSSDFPELILNQTSDGDPDYGEIEWSKKLTKKEEEEAPSASDLYYEGNIDECEYSFGKGGLYSMSIECGDYKVKITE